MAPRGYVTRVEPMKMRALIMLCRPLQVLEDTYGDAEQAALRISKGTRPPFILTSLCHRCASSSTSSSPVPQVETGALPLRALISRIAGLACPVRNTRTRFWLFVSCDGYDPLAPGSLLSSLDSTLMDTVVCSCCFVRLGHIPSGHRLGLPEYRLLGIRWKGSVRNNLHGSLRMPVTVTRLQ